MAIPMNKVDYYRLRYTRGTILELTEPIDDPYSYKPVGSRMKVSYIDDAGQIHGSWLAPASGSIAIIIGKDSFKIVEDNS